MGQQAFFNCVVGLGNPGERYRGTRHNVGFMVADRLAEKYGLAFRRSFWYRAELCREKERSLTLVKPRTFMNRSGATVRRLCSWWGGFQVERLLVVVDDLALPLGAVRIRAQGSAGGHNGLKSLIETLGSERFARVRVGIGACPAGASVVDFVLSDFGEAEREQVTEAVERAAEAVEYTLEHGLEKAMNKVN